MAQAEGASACPRPLVPFAPLLCIGAAGRVNLALVIHQDALSITVEIIELPAAGGPKQDDHGHQAENQHAGDETVDDFHGQRPQRSPGAGLRPSRNREWIRAELAITANELSGMETAAMSGVTRAAIANGTMTML